MTNPSFVGWGSQGNKALVALAPILNPYSHRSTSPDLRRERCVFPISFPFRVDRSLARGRPMAGDCGRRVGAWPNENTDLTNKR